MDTALIKSVIHTLGSVEIRGRENMEKMLGCINALESIVKSVESAPESEERGCDNG